MFFFQSHLLRTLLQFLITFSSRFIKVIHIRNLAADFRLLPNSELSAPKIAFKAPNNIKKMKSELTATKEVIITTIFIFPKIGNEMSKELVNKISAEMKFVNAIINKTFTIIFP